jgi:seryl-tRNA synthetase
MRCRAAARACLSLAGGRAQAKEDTAELQERSKGLKQSIASAEEESQRLERGRDATLAGIGNYVHDSVPVSADEVLRPACRHGARSHGAALCHAHGHR